MTFGLLETDCGVARRTGALGWGAVILKSGFDGVKCIALLGTYLKCLKGQGWERRRGAVTVCSPGGSPVGYGIGFGRVHGK